jgi:gliding motility-associated-like protein
VNKFLFIIFFLLSSATLRGQFNHVVNGGFENYIECPTSYSYPGNAQLENCIGWRIPTYGTSDYFNVCAPYISQVNIPGNVSGYQYAHNGEGYCGFYAYQYGMPIGYLLWHEYIQGTIYPPLEAGKVYQVSFYVNLAEVSNIASSKLGAYISMDSVTRIDASPLNYTPQIINPTNNFITDTASWVQVSGQYTASGGENYITLGWWGDSLECDTLVLTYFVSLLESYYYIDDVSIVEDTTAVYLITPNIFTPNNDGVNDNWYPILQNIVHLGLVIYNRWGDVVFSGDENNYTWDGNFQNRPCSDGTYFYVIQAIGNDVKTYQKKGFIQLFR